MDTPISEIVARLGGPCALARKLRMSQPTVTRWPRVPADRAVQIERVTGGAETVEALRPDLRWVRVPDPTWPCAAGRPLLDLDRPA